MPPAVPEIVVATGNPAKVAAVARAVAGLALARPLPHDISPEDGGGEEGWGSAEGGGEVGWGSGEERRGVEAIARAKAAAGSRALAATEGRGGAGPLVVATDGGLLIPALGAAWAPSRTRRFAGTGASDRDRADALLALTDNLWGDERRIGWREALAVARGGRVLAAWTAEDRGGLLARDYDPALLADDGFWVPALWVCPELGGRRLAALPPAERAGRDDHWARLGAELRRYLRERL